MWWKPEHLHLYERHQKRGRPYPEEFDDVQYLKGFVPPLFKNFDGTGNPRQHVAHFRASCYNARGNDALLFRQFVNNLSGVTFDWYTKLPNGSVTTFTELEDLFMKRFAGPRHHITVGDLVIDKQRTDETLVDYILRWRNINMKCEPQLQEQHAIEILLKSIHGPIAFLLKGFTIKTFENLLSKAGSLQKEAKQLVQATIRDQELVKPVLSIRVEEDSKKTEKPTEKPKCEMKLDRPRLVTTDLGVKSLKPLTLYDFFFAPPGAGNTMKFDFDYALTVSIDGIIGDDSPNPDTNLNLSNDS
ncbi:uncharacterized protein LOC110033161 [Phalaenopsis equestris]|uniref:uncharacterized protein LOC110033161 n=1 Tax=Phalaenopsis equestris TaxID=78828 RepID=UPI0009E35C6C|nr:uncharacterized protein LOC110033161 [Phalaenopsis equestris]